MTVNDFDYLV